jgi:hypothetical protein
VLCIFDYAMSCDRITSPPFDPSIVESSHVLQDATLKVRLTTGVDCFENLYCLEFIDDFCVKEI